MRNLHITVSNRVATYLARDGDIVCDNSDYQITFIFDAEWDSYESKTARFIWNDKYVDVVFTGTTVTVPIISQTKSLKVGVYAGKLTTTTCAKIPCVWSVLCENAMPNTGGDSTNTPSTGNTVDLSNYYTKSEINALIGSIETSGTTSVISNGSVITIESATVTQDGENTISIGG